MTPFDEAVLHLTIPKVQAWERLNDSDYCGQLNMAQYYDLLIAAGYPKNAAQKAANKRGWQRLEAGVKL